MKTVLVALLDPGLGDQIKAGIRNFAGLRPVAVARDQLLEVAGENCNASAVILDHDEKRGHSAELLGRLRHLAPELTILTAGPRAQRESLQRLKLELDIFSFIPLPLDPFDLARRLNRLAEALQRGAQSLSRP